MGQPGATDSMVLLVACPNQKVSDPQEDVAPFVRMPERSATIGAAPNLARADRTCIARICTTAMRTPLWFGHSLGHQPVRAPFTAGVFNPRRLHKGMPDIVNRNDSERRTTASEHFHGRSPRKVRRNGPTELPRVSKAVASSEDGML
jgi:hypothetical protein